jgi:DNA mismatch repair protein MSH6
VNIQQTFSEHVYTFQDRELAMFPFLDPKHRRDAKGCRPDDPNFDPTTVQLPRDFPNIKMANGEKKTITGGQVGCQTVLFAQ